MSIIILSFSSAIFLILHFNLKKLIALQYSIPSVKLFFSISTSVKSIDELLFKLIVESFSSGIKDSIPSVKLFFSFSTSIESIDE